jgi:hypothetical protein
MMESENLSFTSLQVQTRALRLRRGLNRKIVNRKKLRIIVFKLSIEMETR